MSDGHFSSARQVTAQEAGERDGTADLEPQRQSSAASGVEEKVSTIILAGLLKLLRTIKAHIQELQSHTGMLSQLGKRKRQEQEQDDDGGSEEEGDGDTEISKDSEGDEVKDELDASPQVEDDTESDESDGMNDGDLEP